MGGWGSPGANVFHLSRFHPIPAMKLLSCLILSKRPAPDFQGSYATDSEHREGQGSIPSCRQGNLFAIRCLPARDSQSPMEPQAWVSLSVSRFGGRRFSRYDFYDTQAVSRLIPPRSFPSPTMWRTTASLTSTTNNPSVPTNQFGCGYRVAKGVRLYPPPHLPCHSRRLSDSDQFQSLPRSGYPRTFQIALTCRLRYPLPLA